MVSMQKACSILIGSHDFSSFRATGCQVLGFNILFHFKPSRYFFCFLLLLNDNWLGMDLYWLVWPCTGTKTYSLKLVQIPFIFIFLLFYPMRLGGSGPYIIWYISIVAIWLVPKTSIVPWSKSMILRDLNNICLTLIGSLLVISLMMDGCLSEVPTSLHAGIS